MRPRPKSTDYNFERGMKVANRLQAMAVAASVGIGGTASANTVISADNFDMRPDGALVPGSFNSDPSTATGTWTKNVVDNSPFTVQSTIANGGKALEIH